MMKRLFLFILLLTLLTPIYAAPYFYVAFRSNNSLYQISNTGVTSHVPMTGISDAYIVKRYMNDQLLISDHSGGNVVVINQQGQTQKSHSNGLSTGVASNSAGTIYYGSWYSSVVNEWTNVQTSNYATVGAAVFGGIAVTEVSGKQYVYAAASTTVYKIDPDTKNSTAISIPGYSWPNLVNDTLGNVFAYGVYGSESTITKIATNNTTSTFYTANSGSTIAGIDYSIWDGKYYVLEENTSTGKFSIYTTTGGTKTLYMGDIVGLSGSTQAGFVVFDNAVIPEPSTFVLLILAIFGIAYRKK